MHHERHELRRGPDQFDAGIAHGTYGCELGDPHYHEYFELLLCETGSFTTRIGDNEYELGPNDAVLIKPMEVHRLTVTAFKGETRYWILKFLPEILFSAEQPLECAGYLLNFLRLEQSHCRVYRAQALEDAPVPALVREAVEEFMIGLFGFELAVRGAICQIFAWVLRDWQKNVAGKEDVWIDANALMLMRRAFAFIDANYAGEITLADVATYCGMAYTAFSRFFKRHAHKGFSKSLMLARIRRADLLLATTTLPVLQIATQTGFSTTSYFTKCFRAVHAITPLEYRKQFARSGMDVSMVLDM